MAVGQPKATSLHFLVLFCMITISLLLSVSAGSPNPEGYGQASDSGFQKQQGQNREKLGVLNHNMRSLIGSTAPACTYNECRGCRFTCRAKQVPVDATDPVNSAYRHRCVCHW